MGSVGMVTWLTLACHRAQNGHTVKEKEERRRDLRRSDTGLFRLDDARPRHGTDRKDAAIHFLL